MGGGRCGLVEDAFTSKAVSNRPFCAKIFGVFDIFVFVDEFMRSERSEKSLAVLGSELPTPVKIRNSGNHCASLNRENRLGHIGLYSLPAAITRKSHPCGAPL